jgi:hypothetical protein
MSSTSRSTTRPAPERIEVWATIPGRPNHPPVRTDPVAFDTPADLRPGSVSMVLAAALSDYAATIRSR